MSGTSADGINVALVRITGRSENLLLSLLGHSEFAYPQNVRRQILASMNSANASVPDLARLNFLLGELYATAILSTQKKLRTKADLVGCHGQTIYHQGSAARFLGRKLAVTWQTGEASVIAARTGLPVVSDFRPADMAVGGKGAPLVPYLDYLLYRNPKIGRIALNIGGIANLTAIPPNASLDQVIAFDTGPGNMVIDALTDKFFRQPFDRDGKIAASGRVIESVVARFLRHRFFRQTPPKTAGREQFGREFVDKFLRACGPRANKHDIIATASALTATSIGDAVARFVLPRASVSEVIVSGGGAHNPTLMAWLANEVRASGLLLRSSDEFGIPSEAKEAVAFAVLAYETWNRQPSNVPSATGAKRAAVLGKVSFP
jgi:anhydro-N-acetylmuramic acid kinase